MIMKNEANNCRIMNLIDAVINGNRESLNMIPQNLGLSVSILNDINVSESESSQKCVSQ
jgi:hypothetical protein